jgi:guanylate kinase
MMPYVITLTGPSQCGKSTVIKLLKKLSESGAYPDFKLVQIPKYTTRDFRADEIAAVVAGKESELDVLPVTGNYNRIEAANTDKVSEQKMQAFKAQACDLAYEQYGNRYGLRLGDLYARLKKGEVPIVILNDVRTVEDIKTALGRQCVSLFIFREVPNLEKFMKQAVDRNESKAETVARFEKAVAIYRIYIESIHIFDKLLLNVRDNCVELEIMLRQLIETLRMPAPEFRNRQ